MHLTTSAADFSKEILVVKEVFFFGFFLFLYEILLEFPIEVFLFLFLLFIGSLPLEGTFSLHPRVTSLWVHAALVER